jgi:hypothetical protein
MERGAISPTNYVQGTNSVVYLAVDSSHLSSGDTLVITYETLNSDAIGSPADAIATNTSVSWSKLPV